ncbi:MAG TPA: cell division protein FtsQ/DivIB [Xanthobacteraceae bacterium]|nr:cell division protein FtsQ/DivIB [Xanthobacteraceae bacterium]
MNGRTRPASATARRSRAARRPSAPTRRVLPPTTGRLGTLARRLNARADGLEAYRPPRGAGVAATVLLIAGAIALGIVRGGHVAEAIEGFHQMRDGIADAVGFNITSVALTGNKHLSREQIFAEAGVTGHSSLLFLDVAEARAKLQTNPWIADATVRKLYPDRLEIAITERAGFALWQKDGRIGVIADDGTVVEPYLSRAFVDLPLFVGVGAAPRAKDFLALIDRYPAIRDQMRAAILVAERRWNLRLKNGIDVKLPETDVAAALDRLVALDRDKKLLTRDIVSIDLRLPDRVTVRLTDAAATAREETLKPKKPKPRGSA